MTMDSKRLNSQRVLVTGANGQLGTEVVKLLAKEGALGDGSRVVLFATDLDKLDITKREEVIGFVKENRIQMIVNCAAYTAVDKAEQEREACFAANSDAPANLAFAAAAMDALLVHISTDYVFAGNGPLPYKEDDITAPTSVYGQSKVKGERMVAESCSKHLILRTSWLYSPYGNNFVKTIARLSLQRESLDVVFDQIGTPTYSGDLAAAIVAMLGYYCRRGDEMDFPYGIYHYSNEGVCSWYDFAVEIAKGSGAVCKVLPVTSGMFPTAAKRPPYSVMDKTKIKRNFSMSIPHWKDSLEICLKLLKQ